MSEKQPKPVSEEKPKPPLVPTVVSILALIVWVIFLLWFIVSLSPDFDLFQNIVITLGSLLLVGLVVGLMWVVWGFTAGGWSSS
ncbi:MAG: hypothetical protein OEY83_06010 [Candidatus Bathyarchaeota archaeon]|nr:hypothetical protein [Candidatus Bathyarchaeota archaeon]MDH5713476.1 hypothetical protein [Candidatus Bathyarchaeota archaeon]